MAAIPLPVLPSPLIYHIYFAKSKSNSKIALYRERYLFTNAPRSVRWSVGNIAIFLFWNSSGLQIKLDLVTATTLISLQSHPRLSPFLSEVH